MSTRGCAIGTPERWRGVYNHWDSYPTGLGQEVWLHLKTILQNGKTLDDFARELLTYDDWRAYRNQGICEYCGQRTTQPHSISGLLFTASFLDGDVWAERQQNGWRVHRADGPAVICKDGTFYFWRGWRVSPRTVMKPPTTERILAETNQTEREVLLQRMGMENFAREADLQPVDSFSGSALLKVNTAETRRRWQSDRGSVEERVPLAFLKVICPSTQKTYFLRVDPTTETAKQALESTLPGYRRDWQQDLVAES